MHLAEFSNPLPPLATSLDSTHFVYFPHELIPRPSRSENDQCFLSVLLEFRSETPSGL